jgi:diaminopimelate decarboxylase
MTEKTKSEIGATILHLRPAVHPAVNKFLSNKKQVRELVAALGSPLNVMFPDLLSGNIQPFLDTFSRNQIRGRVFFAHKTTRSDSLIKQLAVEDVAMDVASVNELKHALASGFNGSRLEATGPKNAEFLALCLLHAVVLNIDSIAELRQAIAIRELLHITRPTSVLLRLSGFGEATSASLKKSSRFGTPLADIEEAFTLIENNSGITLLGFSFHLDTTSVQERVVAIESCIALFDEAIDRGFSPQVLNIGGGFRVNYLADEHDWSAYLAAFKQSVLTGRSPLTWQNNTFGLSVEAGSLKGNFNSYSFYEPAPGAKFLQEILSQRVATRDDATVAEILSSNMIELWVEPGRAIVDQCGVTIARVNSLRKASGGEQLVSLNMKRADLAFLDQEVFVDPLILYKRQPKPSSSSGIPVFFTGNLCLESDLICRHATFLQKLPEEGDLVAFINTAGYSMDFSASNSIMQPPGRKVAVNAQGDGFVWVLDEQFSPVWQFYNQEA